MTVTYLHEPALDTAADDPAPESADVETLLLCALLFAGHTTAAEITALLEVADFHDPLHAELFEAMAALSAAGQPHDPAMVLTHLERHGLLAGHHGSRLAYALTGATTAGADPTSALYYAHAVVSAAYRRSFRKAGAAITDAAETLPEHELFEHLLTIGYAQRAATRRLDRFRALIGAAPAVGVTE
ncbi:DnaB-like helicase N-terminal domain-containing protein [Rhodococcus phenolicus]|uniref:DnaB-like helicase N-terminal domain-containing protein n=1 Tax=Rhodococcus phenolicus TaxID=263849 RepID=UPI0008368164|nr:DnaB-like helicase N-terminal domain-containing protein [Rhodococcus phenolicus]